MLDYQRFLEGFDKSAFLADRKTCDAVAMHVYVISEAAGRISDEARAGLGDFPWSQIRGVRNRLAHGYASLNFEMIWVVATHDLATLESACRAALGPDPDLPATDE